MQIGMPNVRTRPNVFVTDFREYAVGAQPADWTSRWVATGFTALVQTVAGSISGQALRWTKTTNVRQALSWDKVPLVADVQILMRCRAIEAYANSEQFMRSIARGSGAGGTENGYVAGVLGINTGTLWARLAGKYTAGTPANLGSAVTAPAPNYAVNDWVWLRFQMIGTQHSMKAWKSGSAEPGTFPSINTDATIAGPGWVGLQNAIANPNVEIDYFSVGINGRAAPGP